MRAAHFAAFEAALKSAVPALASRIFDGDAPTNEDGTILRATYVVLHDMGFDEQSDDRLSVETADAADGTYRVVVRCVGATRAAVRSVADTVKTGMTGQRLTILSRTCGAVVKDPGPDAIERDMNVSPPLFFADLDFIWRSSRA